MTRDPLRLHDDPTEPELARALREAQADVLSPEAVARVQTALSAAGVGGAPGASRPLLQKLLASVHLRVGLAVVGIGVGVVGAASRWHAPSPQAAPSSPPDQATAPASPASPASLAPVAPAPAEAQEPPPEAATAADTPPEATASAARANVSARPPPVGGDPRASTSRAPSPREGALLLEARSVLGTNPARSLALVHVHEQEFPASQLGAERARIAAEARQRLRR